MLTSDIQFIPQVIHPKISCADNQLSLREQIIIICFAASLGVYKWKYRHSKNLQATPIPVSCMGQLQQKGYL